MNKKNSHKRTHISGTKLAPETQMMHYGYNPSLSEGSVKCPNFQTSTFVFDSAQKGKDFFNYISGRVETPEDPNEFGLVYSRFNNPVLEILENRIAYWDGAEECIVTGTGMSAISTAVLAICNPGDVVIYSEPIYGGTDLLFKKILVKFNIRGVGFISKGDIKKNLQEAIQKAQDIGNISAMLIETPGNPNNDLVDIRHCANEIAKIKNENETSPLLIVDNTMCGPIFQSPLSLGADINIYSLTKYIGGHSDIVGGSISGTKETTARIRSMRNTIGTTMDPNTAWLVLRSLETLKLRMEKSSLNAFEVAVFLQKHKKVKKVYHLDFLEKNSPQHQIYEKQCKGAGSTFSFEIVGDESAAFRFLDSMKIINLAVSLGGTETLAQHPASMTHSGVETTRRLEIGITDSLIRISVGIENAEDIIMDINQALENI